MAVAAKIKKMATDPKKDAVRLKVLEHFNRYPIERFMSLPAECWDIEDVVLSKGGHVIAFEKKAEIAKKIEDKRFSIGVIESIISYPILGKGRRKNPAEVLCSGACTLIKENLRRFLEHMPEAVLGNYGRWDGAWVDLCGCFGKTDNADTNYIMENLHKGLSSMESIPIAIGFLCNRDKDPEMKSRSKRLKKALELLGKHRDFEMLDYLPYMSTSPMMVILGEYL